VDAIIVDNGGDYPQLGDETVLRQASNLGWAGGTNAGLVHARAAGYDGYVLLNNDTRLSTGFFAGLWAAAGRRRVGIAGPRYDDHFSHQRVTGVADPTAYLPRPREHRVAFVDGTCLLIKREVIDRVGMLDEEAFRPTGWGADLDLALRVRRAGWRVVVTDRSYLSHATASTAHEKHGGADEYWARGDADLRRGLEAKWGPDWRWLTGLEGWGPKARLRRLLRR
jgi:GT2 family glycosyltransferase